MKRLTALAITLALALTAHGQKAIETDANAKTFWENLSDIPTAPLDSDTKADLRTIIGLPAEVKSANFTAVDLGNYVATATLTVTDPTPAEGARFSVLVTNGTATIGGTAYSVAGTIVERVYRSASWTNYSYQVASSFAATAHTHLSADVTDATVSGTANRIVIRGAAGQANFNATTGSTAVGGVATGTGGGGIFTSVDGTGLTASSETGIGAVISSEDATGATINSDTGDHLNVGTGALVVDSNGDTTLGGVITASNLEGTNTGDQDLSVAIGDINNSQPNVLKKFTSGSAPVEIAFTGDSLMVLGRPSLGPLMGEVGRFGAGVSVGTTVDSFDYWVTGKTTSLAIGQTGEFACGDAAATPRQGSRFTLYYIKESGAGTFDLEYQANGTGSWTRFTVGTNGTDGTVNASNGSTIGAVFTATLPVTSSPSYKVRMTNITTGSVKVIGAGIYYHQGGGVIPYVGIFDVGGVDFPNPNTTPSAILNPILADMQLDCVISCWADDGTNWDDGGGFDLFYDKFIAQYAFTDFVQLSTHPLTIASAAAEQVGFEKQRQWAIRNKQTFLNCWEIFKGSAQWMADNGLKSTADDPHLTTAGGRVRNAHIWSRLPIGHMNMGSLGTDTIAGGSDGLGQYFTLQGGDSSPEDAIVYANRPMIFRGSSGGVILQDRSNQYLQSANPTLFNTGGEFFLNVGSNTIATTGTSSFGGWHPGSNGRTLGGRGSFWWNLGGAGLRLEYAAKTADYTIVGTDYTINITTGSPVITLPDSLALNATTTNYTNAAAGAMGKIYVVKNSGAGSVTLKGADSTRTSGVTNGTTTITYASNGVQPNVGDRVTGTDIPADTYIVTATTTSAVLNNAATGSSSGLTFTMTEAIDGITPQTLTTNTSVQVQSTATGWITLP